MEMTALLARGLLYACIVAPQIASQKRKDVVWTWRDDPGVFWSFHSTYIVRRRPHNTATASIG